MILLFVRTFIYVVAEGGIVNLLFIHDVKISFNDGTASVNLDGSLLLSKTFSSIDTQYKNEIIVTLD